ncbi:hypothetical protein Pfo_019440 [Paulownia fortunei]|nr:hypothetical protein Pfo_019440 [Paulownia fortunei]
MSDYLFKSKKWYFSFQSLIFIIKLSSLSLEATGAENEVRNPSPSANICFWKPGLGSLLTSKHRCLVE